jgi:hypothetical protein
MWFLYTNLQVNGKRETCGAMRVEYRHLYSRHSGVLPIGNGDGPRLSPSIRTLSQHEFLITISLVFSRYKHPCTCLLFPDVADYRTYTYRCCVTSKLLTWTGTLPSAMGCSASTLATSTASRSIQSQQQIERDALAARQSRAEARKRFQKV